jgi:Arc/MetJ-type ribon-helix-helix transcriptional regulator
MSKMFEVLRRLEEKDSSEKSSAAMTERFPIFQEPIKAAASEAVPAPVLEVEIPVEQPQPELATVHPPPPAPGPGRRMIAEGFDALMVLIAMALFVGIFFAVNGWHELTKLNESYLVAVLFVLGLFYRVFWAVARRDTPGMFFGRLRVVDEAASADREEQASLPNVAVTAGPAPMQLTLQTERLVLEELDRGSFRSADEVIAEGVHALRARKRISLERLQQCQDAAERLRELRKGVTLGELQLEDLAHEGHGD